MNREDIIRMAQEAGLAFDSEEFPEIWQTYMYVGREEIERFAALVAFAEREYLRESFRVVTAAEASAAILHEREACAKVCDDKGMFHEVSQGADVAFELATAIRARGQA